MSPKGLLLVCLVTLLSAHGGLASAKEPSKHEHAFASFVDTHARTFHRGSREFEERLSLYSRRATEVERLNRRPHRLWTASINALSDRTEDELRQLRGWRGGARSSHSQNGAVVTSHGIMLAQNGPGIPLPSEFMNWTSLESLNNVKNQGSCGACWAITSATVLEAHAEIYAPKKNIKRTFSPQELLSCVPNPHSCGGEGGCDGATVELAMDYVMRHGLAKEAETPYQAVTGSCSHPSQRSEGVFLARKVGLPESRKVTGTDDDESVDLGAPGVHLAQTSTSAGLSFGMHAWQRLPENKYEPMLRAIVDHGPVGVSVAASAWNAYSSGVFDSCEKDGTIDHAVTMIGFGKDHTLNVKYWLIRNSWGQDWGESGNIRLLRRDDEETEHCGVDSQPELGTACKGAGPKEVTICGMCGVLYDSVVPHFKAVADAPEQS